MATMHELLYPVHGRALLLPPNARRTDLTFSIFGCFIKAPPRRKTSTTIKSVTMRAEPESPNSDENPSQKQDPLERRRLQNRLSQRNHRMF